MGAWSSVRCPAVLSRVLRLYRCLGKGFLYSLTFQSCSEPFIKKIGPRLIDAREVKCRNGLSVASNLFKVHSKYISKFQFYNIHTDLQCLPGFITRGTTSIFLYLAFQFGVGLKCRSGFITRGTASIFLYLAFQFGVAIFLRHVHAVFINVSQIVRYP